MLLIGIIWIHIRFRCWQASNAQNAIVITNKDVECNIVNHSSKCVKFVGSKAETVNQFCCIVGMYYHVVPRAVVYTKFIAI